MDHKTFEALKSVIFQLHKTPCPGINGLDFVRVRDFIDAEEQRQIEGMTFDKIEMLEELFESWQNGNKNDTREAIRTMTPGQVFEFISYCAGHDIEIEELENLFSLIK
jgi:hypothetical protein